MRRLPVYFLIDVSESMVGEPIRQVEEGLARAINALKADPYALETVWVSVLVFAGKARTLVPLQELVNFYPPRFPIGGGTVLGAGLKHLSEELHRNVVKTTYERKGDWKPLVFLFTDGVPTEAIDDAVEEWKGQWQGNAHLVAISLGEDADLFALGKLTDDVLLLKDADEAAYKSFFKWITDSIKKNSESVSHNKAAFELAKPTDDTLSKIDLKKYPAGTGNVDPNFVVFTAKCAQSKRPYLIKYRKQVAPSLLSGLNLTTLSYHLAGAYAVDEAYFDLSGRGTAIRINSGELMGAPPCPCCGNDIGFAMCRCGKVHCLGEATTQTCPWCGNMGQYGMGEGGFDVGRAVG
jgi:uncharacterized protein YegL